MIKGAPHNFLAVLLGLICSFANAQSYIETDTFDAAVRAIENGMRANSARTGHGVLLALRQLQDPAMKPLFQWLLESDDPILRTDAILALAELPGQANGNVIDPFLLLRFPPRERQIALSVAIELNLIDRQVTEALLQSNKLSLVEQAMLLTLDETVGVDSTNELDRLLAIANDPENETTRLVGAILLADAGDDANFPAALKRFAALPNDVRENTIAAIAELTTHGSSRYAVEVLRLSLEDAAISRAIRLAAVDAALSCDCDAGIALWNDAAASAFSGGDRTRLGVSALAHGLKREDWSAIRDEHRVNQVLADAGEAFARGNGIDEATTALINLRHSLLLEAALAIIGHLDTTDPALATRLREKIIVAAIDDPRLYAVAGRVITDLADTSTTRNDTAAALTLARLLGQIAQDKEGLAESAMIGLLNASGKTQAGLETPFRTHPNRTVRSLALLVQAKRATALEADDLAELALVASGGGRVDKANRAIAAWYWLRVTGSTDRAIARVLSTT